jgi:hypothetical protein
MMKPQLTDHLKLSKRLIFTVAVLMAGSSTARTEVLHVSPEPLAGVPQARQHRTIGAAAGAVKPGDVVRIHTGVYREQVYIPTSGTRENPIRFEAAPAANVTITGADRLLDWKKEGGESENLFSAPWPHRLLTWAGDHTYPKDTYHELIGRTEQVFVDNYPLQQVLKREHLGRGTFWVDLENKRLYVWASNNAKLGPSVAGDPPVEASVRPLLWQQEGDYVHVRGIRFRYAANQAQGGAANFKGRAAVVEDCIFEQTNTVGASFGGTGRRDTPLHLQDNGQLGWAAYRAHNLLMTDCLTRNNNTKNFNRSWEAGGNKIAMARGVVIEKSRFEDNRGVGLWFDIGLENTTVRNCLFANNENVGLFYEIAYGMHAHDNVVIGNGFASYGGAWGASGGISLASSPDCIIERNLIIANKEGFQFREHLRSTPRIDDKRALPATPSGTRTRSSATTSSPTTAMPRCGRGLKPATRATGPLPCKPPWATSPAPKRACSTTPPTSRRKIARACRPTCRSKSSTSASPTTCSLRETTARCGTGACRGRTRSASTPISM